MKLIFKETLILKTNKAAAFTAAISIMALFLTACSSGGNSSIPDTQAPVVTEPAETAESIAGAEKTESETSAAHIPVADRHEDFFSRLDTETGNQIILMASKLPELIENKTYIYITDLDGNGRRELILSDPEFVIYEVSEDGKTLEKTVTLNEDYPSVYPVADRLICVDSENRRHYIFRSVADKSAMEILESEKEYIYENGQLNARILRSRTFDKLSGNFISYNNSEGNNDPSAYSTAVSDILFRSGNRLMQCSVGVLSSEDIRDTDPETLRQLLSELAGFFTVTEPKERYSYTDLEGAWTRTGGFASGSGYFPVTADNPLKLVFRNGMYELNGAVNTAPAYVSFGLGGNRGSSLWYAELGQNSVIKNASVTISRDGVLTLEGTASDSDGRNVSIKWTFSREGLVESHPEPDSEQVNPESVF